MAKLYLHLYTKEGKTNGYVTAKPQPPGIRAESSLEIEQGDPLVENNFGRFLDKIRKPGAVVTQWLDNADMQQFIDKVNERDDELEGKGVDPETGKKSGKTGKAGGKVKWKVSDERMMKFWGIDKNQLELLAYLQNENSDGVTQIIKSGVNPNFEYGKHNKETTPLESAIRYNNIDLVKALVDGGADVNLTPKSSPMTPLIVAIRQNEPGIVEFLVNAGADVNARTKFGSVLDWVKEDTNEIIKDIITQAGGKSVKNIEGKEASQTKAEDLMNKSKTTGAWGPLDDNTMARIEPMLVDVNNALDRLVKRRPKDTHLSGAVQYVKKKLKAPYTMTEAIEPAFEGQNDEQVYTNLMEVLSTQFFQPLKQLAGELEDPEQQKAVNDLYETLDAHFGKQLPEYFDFEDEQPKEYWVGDEKLKKGEEKPAGETPTNAKPKPEVVKQMMDAGKDSEEIAKAIKVPEQKPQPATTPAQPEAQKPAEQKPTGGKAVQKLRSMAPKMEKEIRDRFSELPEEDRAYAEDLLKKAMEVIGK